MSQAQVFDYAVIGGGISGLATAYYLEQAGFRVQVVEADARLGGRLWTEQVGDCLFERGANSTFSKPEILALAEAVGLKEHVIQAQDLAKNRYIATPEGWQALPMTPPALVKSRLFSVWAKLGLLLEPFKGKAKHEESVGDFVARRLGQEFVDWAVDPFVSGVWAGDVKRLSVQAAFPKLWLMERDEGSVFKALRKAQALKDPNAGYQGIISFKTGMQSLPLAVAAQLKTPPLVDAAVQTMEKTPEGTWNLQTEQGLVQAKQVVMTQGMASVAGLLKPIEPKVAVLLNQIPAVPLAEVTLAFKAEQIGRDLDGFGFLIPRSLGVRTLGCIFSSSVFAGRAPECQVVLTAFIGGRHDEKVAQLSEAEMLAQVLADLKAQMPIEGEPLASRVTLWNPAIPQYELGHLERVKAIRTALKSPACEGILIRANWHEGVSVADIVANAQRFAQVQAGLAQWHAKESK
jgi:oxygen-dependent protoporphyrinogen oxidase